MLGSAIPKRWVVSLALVGLVSLFMASFAAGWAGTASAGTTGEGEILSDLLAPGVLNIQVGQVISISASPINDLGNEDISLESVLYSWISGDCGTLDNTTSRTPKFTAVGSACTGTISVHAIQGGLPNESDYHLRPKVPSSDRVIKVNVAAPPPAPAATVASVDPAVIPNIVPSGLSADDVAVILPSSGGTFSVAQGSGPPISISIPGSALDSGAAAAVTINVVSTGDVEAPPVGATEGATSGTFMFGSIVIEIKWFDENGTALDTFRLNRPAEICVPYNQADLDAAAGGPDGLAVWRYNGTEWIQLNSTVNTGNGTVCARTLDFSAFALGLAVPAPDTLEEEVELPTTGDYTPGVGILILAMMAGVALVGAGAFTARRARRVRETSHVS